MTSKEVELIDLFCKTNPMPERTYCKEAWKIQDMELNFKHEYKKDGKILDEDMVEEMEENGINCDKYITPESREKCDQVEHIAHEKMFEHTAKCSNEYCKWAYKRDSFVKEKLEK